MKYIIFTIFFVTFSLSENYNENWDDFVLDNFILDDELKFLNIQKISNELENNCVLKPKTFSSIDDICDAIRHYKKGSGDTVTANSNLIEHVINFNKKLLRLPSFSSKVYF